MSDFSTVGPLWPEMRFVQRSWLSANNIVFNQGRTAVVDTGYCTEAAAEMLRYAFEDLGLHRVMARHFRSNPASGRVMQKIGMQYEGRMREHFWRWDQAHDIELYGILRREWQARAGAEAGTGT